MARRKLRSPAQASPGEGGPEVAPQGSNAQEGRVCVSFVPFEGSRKLRTVDETALVWAEDPKFWRPGHVQDEILRLQPPGDVAEGRVEHVRRKMVEMGAAAVRVQPGRKAQVLPREKTRHVAPRARAREAAMGLVEKATTKDRAALKTAVERSLAEAGL